MRACHRALRAYRAGLLRPESIPACVCVGTGSGRGVGGGGEGAQGGEQTRGDENRRQHKRARERAKESKREQKRAKESKREQKRAKESKREQKRAANCRTNPPRILNSHTLRSLQARPRFPSANSVPPERSDQARQRQAAVAVRHSLLEDFVQQANAQPLSLTAPQAQPENTPRQRVTSFALRALPAALATSSKRFALIALVTVRRGGTACPARRALCARGWVCDVMGL